MKEAIKKELMRAGGKRFDYLKSLERDSDWLLKMVKEATWLKDKETLSNLLEINHKLRKVVGEQIEEINELSKAQITETELDEELRGY